MQPRKKNYVAWHWEEQHVAALENFKRLIFTGPFLLYYNLMEELTILCDVYQSGFGAALLQNRQPVSVASQAMTSAKENYAQIEENLAIVFGCERFDYCIYKRHVTVGTDHKPLEYFATKPIHAFPKKLQRMMLCLQKYDLNIKSKK